MGERQGTKLALKIFSVLVIASFIGTIVQSDVSTTAFEWPIIASALVAGALSTIAATFLAERFGKAGLVLIVFVVPITIGLLPIYLIMAEAPIQDPSTASNALLLMMIGCNLATYFVESNPSEQ